MSERPDNALARGRDRLRRSSSWRVRRPHPDSGRQLDAKTHQPLEVFIAAVPRPHRRVLPRRLRGPGPPTRAAVASRIRRGGGLVFAGLGLYTLHHDRSPRDPRATNSSPSPSRRRASCPATRASRSTTSRSSIGERPTRARGSRSAPGAASPRSTSAPRPKRPTRCSTRSTTTTAVRRTRRAGSTSTPPSSTRPTVASTRCLPGSAPIAEARLEDDGRRARRTLECRGGALRPAARPALHRRRPRRTTSRGPTTRRGRRRSRVGGLLLIHDVFEDPTDGGRPPYEIYLAALESASLQSSAPSAVRCAR